ncbi:MAG: hypothetical protein LBR25_10465 [Erysipelotrichaceae bacterium]|jgi:flavodoxin|nr:hypothetical protein [Erysipelotrichaceae bacterium]
MKKTAVLYETMTGHSKKIATALSEALKAPLLRAGQKLPEAVEVLVIVSGIYGGKSKESLLDYVANLDPGSCCNVIFVTSSAGVKKTPLVLREAVSRLGFEVLGDHSLPGSFLFLRLFHPSQSDITQLIKEIKQEVDA